MALAMSLSSYVLLYDPDAASGLEEWDIQFWHGDDSERTYRLGDPIQPMGDRDAVLAGIAIVPPPPSGTLGRDIPREAYRYFRVVIVRGRIVSFHRTTEADYDSLVQGE